MRVLIVDDHTLFAQAVGGALATEGIDRVELANDPGGALDVMRDPDRRADVVLMDLDLGSHDGLVAGGRIAREWPRTKVLALTALSDVNSVRDAMRAGFSGYMTKDTHIGRLANAMRAALDGEVVIPHRLASGALTGGDGDTSDPAALLISQLTDRERELLQLLAEGASSDAIADAMAISRNTVRTHVQSVLTKLGVHSRLEAAAFAVRHGLANTRQRRAT